MGHLCNMLKDMLNDMLKNIGDGDYYENEDGIHITITLRYCPFCNMEKLGEKK